MLAQGSGVISMVYLRKITFVDLRAELPVNNENFWYLKNIYYTKFIIVFMKIVIHSQMSYINVLICDEKILFRSRDVTGLPDPRNTVKSQNIYLVPHFLSDYNKKINSGSFLSPLMNPRSVFRKIFFCRIDRVSKFRKLIYINKIIFSKFDLGFIRCNIKL